MTAQGSPRDRYLTIYGRMPVAEAVADPDVPVARVLIATSARGPVIDQITASARRRGIDVERASEQRVAAIARNGRHHQGVVADIAAPGVAPLGHFLAQRRGRLHATSLILLDNLHNPANVGMIIRSATAAGVDGIVVPHKGTAELGPLVVKASAGVSLSAVLLRVPTVTDALAELAEARFRIVGLDAAHAGARSLFSPEALAERAVYVLGNETDGLSDQAREWVESWLTIPLAHGVESLNVACAATLLAFEIARQREAHR